MLLFPNNQEIMDSYLHALELRNKKKVTQRNKLVQMRVFCKFHKHKKLERITKKDVEEFYIEMKHRCENKTLHHSTFQKYIIELRYFFSWLNPENDFFKDIEIPDVPRDISEQDYINTNDVSKMLALCTETRDRAILILLWNSACRVGEIANLKVADVSLEKQEITVIGKTGKRDVPITTALPDLKNWLNVYKAELQDPLFPNFKRKGKPLGVRGIQYIVEELVKKAGITGKHVNAHSFRHGRLTELAGQGITEMQLRIYAGWSRSSNMPEIYINTKQAEVKAKIRHIDGVELETEDKHIAKDLLKPRVCYKCNTLNAFDAQYCSKCFAIVDEKLLLETQESEKKAREEEKEALKYELMKEILEALAANEVKAKRYDLSDEQVDEIAKFNYQQEVKVIDGDPLQSLDSIEDEDENEMPLKPEDLIKRMLKSK